MAETIRLQKALSQAGVASRRRAEELIAQGRVEVNGEIVTRMGLKVDPASDKIRVDGSRVPPVRGHVYLAMNKPRGVVTTMSDERGRPTVADLAPARYGRVFHVGRLDADTEGLLLLTNDGEFAHRLAHPSFEAPKTYLAEVAGRLDPRTLRRLKDGVELDDGQMAVDEARVVQRLADKTLVRLRLHSGRNRVVRRLLEEVGHPVVRLSRTQLGPVRLTGIPVGGVRELTGEELGELLDLLDM